MPEQSTGFDPQLLAFEKYQGINTSVLRVGVPDEQAYWLDGFMPLDARNLRTLPDVGTALYTAVGKTIIWYSFCNIGATPYCVVFQSDGSVIAVNTATAAVSTILAASTIAVPNLLNQAIAQWGSQYLIIVAQQINGYFIWDGNLVYQSGSLAPGIVLTNVGSGYTTPPAVLFSGGSGTGTAAQAVISGGAVTNINITNPGTGWLSGDTVTVTLSGGTSSGTGASITVGLTHAAGGTGATITCSMLPISVPGYGTAFYIGSCSVTAGGSGYSQFTTAVATGGSPVYITNVAIALTISGGVITAATPPPAGIYTNLYYTGTPPTVGITDTAGYFVSSSTIVNPGSGYSQSTKLAAVGGGSPASEATLMAAIANGTISSVTIQTGGLYGSNTAPTITITDTPVTATATATLMPFGMSGNCVEVYQGHVWVAGAGLASGSKLPSGSNNNLSWSAPGSVSDFATSDGGGSQQSTDPWLKVSYTKLLSANGFLYLVGDSSISYISGVTTSGTPPTTTFTQANADAEVGSPFPASVQTFGRNVMYANSWGIHVCYGADAKKVSEPLDGVYSSVANFGGIQLAAAKATIFSKRVWMELVRIVDPVTGSTVNKVCMWDGAKKWWTSEQSVALSFIASQEINSVFTAYGLDSATATKIYPLFNTASGAYEKRAASKLWDAPGSYVMRKTSNRFWGLCYYNSTTSPDWHVSIDSIDQASATVTNQNFTVTGPASTGWFVVPPQVASQQGEFIGLTMKTNAADMQLVSTVIDPQAHDYRG